MLVFGVDFVALLSICAIQVSHFPFFWLPFLHDTTRYTQAPVFVAYATRLSIRKKWYTFVTNAITVATKDGV